MGFSERLRNKQPWPIFDRLCREGLNLESATGGSVDLHHHVPPWLWAQDLGFDELCRHQQIVSYAGVDLPCLSAEANLLVAALHLVSDRNRPGRTLLIWRDLAQLAKACDPAIVASLARSAHVDGWLAATIQALPPFARPEAVAAAVGTPSISRGRRRLRLMLSEGGRYGVRATQPLRLPLLSAVLHEIGMAVPSPTFLRLRYPAGRHRYIRWWREGFFPEVGARAMRPLGSSDVVRAERAGTLSTDRHE
jgi:hypothetical protein